MTASTEPKFPDVEIELIGQDGNAFLIASRVRRALERAGHRDEAKQYFDEALSGDYDNVLSTTMRWVSVS